MVAMSKYAALGASLMILLSACRKQPLVSATPTVEADGVHVRFVLGGIDAVTVAGKVAHDKETIVLPTTLFSIGENRIPMVGEGFNGSLDVKLRPGDVLRFSPTPPDSKASCFVTVRARKPSASGIPGENEAIGSCTVKGGILHAPLTVHPGFQVTLDGSPAPAGALDIDLRKELWDIPKSELSTRKHRTPAVSVRSGAGGTWDGDLEITASWLAVLSSIPDTPGATAGMGAPGLALVYDAQLRLRGQG